MNNRLIAFDFERTTFISFVKDVINNNIYEESNEEVMKSYNGRVNSLDPNLDFDKDSVVELIKEASIASDEETKEPSGYINSKINLYHDVCKSPMVSLIKEALKLP